MGKEIDWVREERTGRLIFRRRYPTDVQKLVGKLELKVPLGAKWRMTESSSRTYFRACDQFDRDVRNARASLRVKEKEASAAYDDPAPWVSFFADELVADRREGSERRLQQGHGRLLGQSWAFLLAELRRIRVETDPAQLEAILGPTADEMAAAEGLRFDPADTEGRASLLWELSARLVQNADDFLKQAEGYSRAIPPRPERPTNPKGRSRTVSALITAYKAAKWDGWSQSSRSAVEPAFRVLKDTVGDKLVTEIDREGAREIFETVKALPVALGRNAELKDLPVPEAVERGRELGLPTIGPKTVNGSYMAHISSAFGWAENEEWIAKNPFRGLAAADPVSARDKRDPFTVPQLNDVFSSAPWDAPINITAAKPGRLWVPLIALYSGMRLGEIAGLRVKDMEEVGGILCFRVRPHQGRTLKTEESRRDIPVHSALVGLGFLHFVQERKKRASDLEELLFPDGKANVKGQSGAKLGEWFVGHLKQRNLVGTKLGMHSFRHNFEDALRLIGFHGRPEGQALAGRKITGSEGGYGTGYTAATLRDVLEQVTYPELDLSHLRP